MGTTIDPYYEWLGIPSKDQPPNHYRLLGIEIFEANPNVIDTAANRQMGFLKEYQAGPDFDLSQRLLNELSAARLCLLSPANKAIYDAQLRAQLDAKGTGPKPSEQDPRWAADAFSTPIAPPPVTAATDPVKACLVRSPVNPQAGPLARRRVAQRGLSSEIRLAIFALGLLASALAATIVLEVASQGLGPKTGTARGTAVQGDGSARSATDDKSVSYHGFRVTRAVESECPEKPTEHATFDSDSLTQSEAGSTETDSATETTAPAASEKTPLASVNQWFETRKKVVLPGKFVLEIPTVHKGRNGSLPVVIVQLQVSNISNSNKLDFRGWTTAGGQSTAAELSDDTGKRLPGIDAAQPEAQTLAPRESVTQTLPFAWPQSEFKKLRLVLPGAALGRKTAIGFEIPRGVIVEVNAQKPGELAASHGANGRRPAASDQRLRTSGPATGSRDIPASRRPSTR